jgi:hypothetical protein
VGIVTLDDVRRVPRDAWDTTFVQAIMTPLQNLVTVTPDEDAAQAMDKLIQRDVRQLPVVRIAPATEMNWATAHIPGANMPEGGYAAAGNYPAAIPATGETQTVETRTSEGSASGLANTGPEFLGLLRRRDIMRWLQLHSNRHGNGREPV